MICVWVMEPEVAVTVMVELPAGVPGYLLLLPQPVTAASESRAKASTPKTR